MLVVVPINRTELVAPYRPSAEKPHHSYTITPTIQFELGLDTDVYLSGLPGPSGTHVETSRLR
jgi:hypothetical protein